MPLYAYTCKHCSANFEIRTSWSDADNQVCPQCDHNELERHFSAFAVGASSTFHTPTSKSCSTQCGGCPFAS